MRWFPPVGGEVIFWFPATEAADVWIVEFLVAVRAHAVPLVVLAAVPAVVLSFPERNAARAVLIGDTHRANVSSTACITVWPEQVRSNGPGWMGRNQAAPLVEARG